MAKRKGKQEKSTAVVLADIPERNRLRELRQLLNERRDQIAEIDLEIETVREQLIAFEGSFRAQIASLHNELGRIERLVQHYERWVELLSETPPRRVVAQAKQLTKRRKRELSHPTAEAQTPPTDATTPTEARKSPDARLKAAYRALARRYHPDLATSETDRVQYSDLMARINALYRDGDLERLEAMAEQAKGGDVDEPNLDVAHQVEVLTERLAWFDMVLDNLRQERVDLERTPTCELMRNVDQAAAVGRSLVDEIREEMRERIKKSYAHVANAAHMLESEVDRFNRKTLADNALTTRQSESLERRFDPFADKRIMRLGLEELRDLDVRPEARALAEELEPRITAAPALMRLVLLTYVTELSPFPLPGLETYDDIEMRFGVLGDKDENPTTLHEALVLGDTWVEFGVTRPSQQVVRMGLRFHDDVLRQAVPLLLKSLAIRRELKRVLGVLGDRERCTGCDRSIFAVPLFRTHGLDDLRALVCPRCAHTLRSYWMPKGKDVQAVLNAAFLDFGIITEWSFQLGRGSFGTQLLPLQVESLHVRELCQRLYDDLFKRYEIELEVDQIGLVQNGAIANRNELLTSFTDTTFVIRFAEGSTVSENEAYELLRHRVRNRFRA